MIPKHIYPMTPISNFDYFGGSADTMEIIHQVKMIFLVRLMIMQRKLLHLFFTEKKFCKTKLRKQPPRGSFQ